MFPDGVATWLFLEVPADLDLYSSAVNALEGFACAFTLLELFTSGLYIATVLLFTEVLPALSLFLTS